MSTIKIITHLKDILPETDLPWLLATLRQDPVVWQSLNEPAFFEKFKILKPANSVFTPDDCSPGRFALLAMGQTDLSSFTPNNLLDSIDSQVLQKAIRGFNDLTLLQGEQNLEEAGLVALALAYKYRATNSWAGLVGVIQEKPEHYWNTPLACLYSFIEKPVELLKALIQPGATSIRYDLGLHAMLSNPISPDEQIALLIDLTHGSFKDPLPALDQLALLQSLSIQHPQVAADFCKKWLEIEPDWQFLSTSGHNDTIINIKNLAEILFQFEVRRIASNPTQIPTLLKLEEECAQHLYADIITHLVMKKARLQPDNFSSFETTEILNKAIQLTSQFYPSDAYSPYQAKLALTLAKAELYDEAYKLLPNETEPLPEDADVLYAIAKLSFQLGKRERAYNAARHLLDVISVDSGSYNKAVWGENFSLVNLAMLFLDINQPYEASLAVNLALLSCPNDVNLLELLAKTLISERKEREAADIYQVLVSLNPSNMDYHRSLAQSLEEIGDWEAALIERTIIMGTIPSINQTPPTNDHYAYAYCALKANQPELTLKVCTEILSINPEDGLALTFTGEAYLITGETDKGMEYLNKATQASPNLPESWLALANAQRDFYQPKMAIETLKTASQTVPDDIQIHYALGELYLQDNAPTLAINELKKAAELSAEDTRILVSLGQALRMLGHLEEARQEFAKAYQIEPEYPGLAYLYAKVLLDLGELEQAIPPLEKVLESKTIHDPVPYLDFARSILVLNKRGVTSISPMKALVALNAVLQIDPTLAEAKALTAEALAANGDKELAFQAFQEALDTSLIDDRKWLERLSYGFGCVAGSMGKHDIAIAALQEACQANPQNPANYMELTNAYLAGNLNEDAIRSARTVLTISVDNPDTLAWFAEQVSHVVGEERLDASNTKSDISKQVLVEALNALTKAIQIAPTRTDLMIKLAKFQSYIGEQAEASETFRKISSLGYATINDLKEAYIYLGKVGDFRGAIASLENAVTLDQKSSENHDPGLYTNLAQAYVKNNDYTSAINALDKAIYIIPGNSALYAQKADILLGLGQPIEALNCINTALNHAGNGKADIDLLFLASRINRSIGDLSSAMKFAQAGMSGNLAECPNSSQYCLPIQYRTQVAEIYRALLQPDQAYRIIQNETKLSVEDFENEINYLDFICLQTELALEIGEPISPDLKELQVKEATPIYSRMMAIKARLVNRAGDFIQAKQLFQMVLNNDQKIEQSVDVPHWSSTYRKYINDLTLLDTALELGFWNEAWSTSQRMMESTSGEPISYLNIVKTLVMQAEVQNLTEKAEVTNHSPGSKSLSKENYGLFAENIKQARLTLEPFRTECAENETELSEFQINRWLARGEIAFMRADESGIDPSQTLTCQQATPEDIAAVIAYHHQLDKPDLENESLSRIQLAARAYPNNPYVILHVALALEEKNPLEAMKAIQTLVELNPAAQNPFIAMCNILLARIAFNLGEYDLAKESIEIALSIWQDEPRWHILAAQVCKVTSEITDAINHLEEAIKQDPNSTAYHVELGKAYFDKANDDPILLKQALKSFERACLLEPKDVNALTFLANTQCLLNDLEHAEQNARFALGITPDRADIYQILSEIAIRRNDFQGAYDYANKAIQICPEDTQSIIMLARSLSALGRHSEALGKLDSAIPSVSEPKTLYLERAKILHTVEGPEAALNALKSLAESFPNDFSVLCALSKALTDCGDLELAVNVAQQALKACTEKTPHNEQANLHLLIGQLLRQSGQMDQAIHHLSEAIRFAPDRLEPYLELGLARKERREYQQALQVFERATAIAPEDPRAPYQAGLALKESKDYKTSEVMLRRAVSLAPNDVTIRRQLAAVVALNLVHNPRNGRN